MSVWKEETLIRLCRVVGVLSMCMFRSPIALRKAKIVYNFGLSECNRVKGPHYGHKL